MSEQDPYMTTIEGRPAKFAPPPSDTPLTPGSQTMFGMDFSKPPAEALGFKPFGSIWDLAKKDPDIRLKLAIRQAQATQQAQSQQLNMLSDSNAMKSILETEETSRRHQEDLQKQVTEFETKMQKLEPPKRQVPQMDQAGTLATAIAALFGGNINQATGAALGSAQQTEDVRFANASTQYGKTYEENQQKLADLRRQQQEAEQWGQRLQGMQIGQQQTDEQRKQVETDKAYEEFHQAKNPGDVDVAVQRLKGQGVNVDKAAIDQAKASANVRYEAEGRAQIRDAMMLAEARGSNLTEAEANSIQKQVDDIADQHGMKSKPIVLRSATWKEQNAKDHEAFLKEKQKAWETNARNTLKLKNEEAIKHYALWQAEEEWYRQRPELTREGITGRQSASALGKVRTAQVALDKVDAELRSLDGQIKNATGKAKRALMARKATLTTQRPAAKQAVDDWNEVYQNEGGQPGGLSGNPASLTGGGSHQDGEEVTLPDGRKFKRQGGAWHPLQ